MHEKNTRELPRREFLALTALGGAALLLPRPGWAATPKRGGSTVWAHEIQVTSLNPINVARGKHQRLLRAGLRRPDGFR